MSVYEGIITFAVCWWLLLFMVLPFGVRPDEQPIKGQVESAPAKPRLLLKFAITTVLAGLATLAIATVINSGMIDFRPAP